MAVGLQKIHDDSSSFMPSNMLSMGEDLVDVRRPHGEQRSWLMLIFFFHVKHNA
jgi:hypothetical protein